MQKMLKENSGSRLIILTNLFIKPELLDVCYNILVAKKGKGIIKQQQEVLKYLSVLQRY